MANMLCLQESELEPLNFSCKCVIDQSDKNFHIAYFKNTKRIILNVGGVRHEVLWKTLEKYPESRLGKIRFAKSFNEMKELCDDINENELFFDRGFNSFETILNLYRTEKKSNYNEAFFCRMKEIENDLLYWGLGEFVLEDNNDQNEAEKSGFQSIYEPKNESKQLTITEGNIFSSVHSIFDHRINKHVSSTLSKKDTIWLLMEYPNSSTWYSRTYMFMSLFFLFLSTASIVLSSLSQLRSKYFVKAFDSIEIACTIWFTLEFLFRFSLSSEKLTFFKSGLNLIDILSILPFYGSFIFSIKYFGLNREWIMVFNMLRIFSVLKLTRHSVGLRSLGYTFRKCFKELEPYLELFLIAILVFSTFVYYAEHKEVDTKFTSIPAAMWWALISLTTVGYGDMVPTTTIGKFLGSLCCISGVFVIALPIPIIVGNLTESYKKHKSSHKALKSKLIMQERLFNRKYIEKKL